MSVNWVQHFNVCKSPPNPFQLRMFLMTAAFHASILICVLLRTVKKLLRNINEYYGDVLRTKSPSLPTEESPNLSSIAKEKSLKDIVKLMRLVLALAVKSDKKEDYVQTIYTLSPDAQKSLMYLLQQVYSWDYQLITGDIRTFRGI